MWLLGLAPSGCVPFPDCAPVFVFVPDVPLVWIVRDITADCASRSPDVLIVGLVELETRIHSPLHSLISGCLQTFGLVMCLSGDIRRSSAAVHRSPAAACAGDIFLSGFLMQPWVLVWCFLVSLGCRCRL